MINAIQLSKSGLNVLLIERHEYPFHRVCGEYISQETLPFLADIGIRPLELGAVAIDRFQLTSISGRSVQVSLDMGGFGFSRYAFDHLLYEKALSHDCSFALGTRVEKVAYRAGTSTFQVHTDKGAVWEAKIVIGAYGKRSKLDKTLERSFITERSPYIGVKYHVKMKHDDDLVALHNFEGGYCGVSNIEGGRTNVCYLSHRDNLRKYGNVPDMERTVVRRNPFLRKIFDEAEFLFEKPLVINEISFAPKSPVEQHLLMCGDAAGMITPLCGNGMAMAIHSAKLLSEQVLRFFRDPAFDRNALEEAHRSQLTRKFATRLSTGRRIQSLFGSRWLSDTVVNVAKMSKPMARYLIGRTHGEAFRENGSYHGAENLR